MSDLEKASQYAKKWWQRRNRHHNHVDGDILYYHCEHMNNWREGAVMQVIPHYGVVYYVLEVCTGPPINEPFLKMVSEYNVRSKDEL